MERKDMILGLVSGRINQGELFGKLPGRKPLEDLSLEELEVELKFAEWCLENYVCDGNDDLDYDPDYEQSMIQIEIEKIEAMIRRKRKNL